MSPRHAVPAPVSANATAQATVFALALLLGACASETPHAVIPPPPPPAVAPPPPPPIDWRDLPVSPGGWHYAADAAGSSAAFGRAGAAPDFLLHCLKATRRITLARPGATTTLTVRTSYGSRALPAAGGVATLAAGDPLFDQIAYSRARFSIEAPAVSLLMMPAWAEPARVVEDCRI